MACVEGYLHTFGNSDITIIKKAEVAVKFSELLSIQNYSVLPHGLQD